MALLKDITPGSEVKLAGLDWIVLEQQGKTTALITKSPVDTMEYGTSGDWRSSKIRRYLNSRFYNALAENIGIANITPHTVNLMADDGTGKLVYCEDNVSLLTTTLYRKYREYIPTERWLWLATRVSYVDGYSPFVCCVRHDGIISIQNADICMYVYPFCTLDSFLRTDDDAGEEYSRLRKISAILSEHKVPVAEIITGEIPYSTLKSCAERLVESGAVAAAGLSKYTPLSGNMSEFKLSITVRGEEK